MSSNTSASIFISYSRLDTEIADRLDADLRARGFNTWMDRRALLGGQDWHDEIQTAIDGCRALLVILTPNAASSAAVKSEFRRALHQSKLVIPLYFEDCADIPMDLDGIQWIDFQSQYDVGLKDLLVAIAHGDIQWTSRRTKRSSANLMVNSDGTITITTEPRSPEHVVSLKDLYSAGLLARQSGDLEAASAYWQQIYDRDPMYLNGVVSTELTSISQILYPTRAARLLQEIELARANGDWGKEIGLLRAWIAIAPDKRLLVGQLAIAETNRRCSDLYALVSELVAQGNLHAAQEQMRILWHRAPYFGDPQGLAHEIGLPSPLSRSAVFSAQRIARRHDIWSGFAIGSTPALLLVIVAEFVHHAWPLVILLWIVLYSAAKSMQRRGSHGQVIGGALIAMLWIDVALYPLVMTLTNS